MSGENRVSRADARWMRGRRADYYAYLSALLCAQDGRRSLRDMFDDDALRFGAHHPRGRLARWWCEAFERNGGDLARSWAGAFPQDELSMIEVAQADGVQALQHTMMHLARLTSVMRRLRRVITLQCLSAAVAAGVMFGMAWAVPLVTVPRLKHVFDSVPQALLGRAARSLYAAADILAVAAPLALALLVVGAMTVWHGKSRWVGRSRRWLDRQAIVRLYRDLQAIQFLTMLTVILGQGSVTDIRLRDALLTMSRHASPWLGMHLQRMLQRLAAGENGVGLLDTGLFDREWMWFMHDVVRARGLPDGLAHMRQQAESRFADQVLRQAQIVRWTVLSAAVGGALALGAWHLLALDDLRQALVLSVSG